MSNFYLIYNVRQHSVYCLVDEVVRREKIMPDKKKKLAIRFFFYFPPTYKKNNGIFIKKVAKSWGICLFL